MRVRLQYRFFFIIKMHDILNMLHKIDEIIGQILETLYEEIILGHR